MKIWTVRPKLGYDLKRNDFGSLIWELGDMSLARALFNHRDLLGEILRR